MKIIATTDTHLGHKMLVENGYRDVGFESKIFSNIRMLSGDMFIHLGDICIGNDEKWNNKLIDSLLRFERKILVRGNTHGT